MQRNLLIILVALALVGAACSPQQPPQTPSGPTDTAYPAPGSAGSEVEPYPGVEEPPPQAYPGPAEPGEQSVVFQLAATTGFDPQPGDEVLERGEPFLRLEESEILVMESYPLQAALILRGDLPDPCHKLRVVVAGQEDTQTVEVQVYTVRNPEELCTAVLEPFEARINLGSFAGGTFTVLVNGTEVGKIQG